MTTVTYEELDSSKVQDMIKEHKSFEIAKHLVDNKLSVKYKK